MSARRPRAQFRVRRGARYSCVHVHVAARPCPHRLRSSRRVQALSRASETCAPRTDPQIDSMASSSAASGGQAKKRRQSGTSLVNKGMDNLLEGSMQKDRQYIISCLDDRPQLLPLVASMLRDGDIDRALQRRKLADLVAVLGNKLGSKVKKHRNLPSRFVDKALNALVGTALFGDEAAEQPAPPGGMPSAARRLEVLLFGLGTTADTPLPKGHAHSEYEGPLLKVMDRRHSDMGNRLKGVTLAQFAAIGYWSWSSSDPTNVKSQVRAGVVVKLPYAAQFMLALEGARIEKNHMEHGANLISTREGFCQGLGPLIATQIPKAQLPEIPADYEYAEAADEFKDVSMAGGGGPTDEAASTPRKVDSPVAGPSVDALLESAGAPPQFATPKAKAGASRDSED